MISLRTLAQALVLFLIFSLPVHARNEAAQRAFSRGDPVPRWVLRATTLPPAPGGAALSVRLNDVQFYASEQSSYYIHRAQTAHEASSLGALGQIEIEFQPDYQRVQLHTLRIVREGQALDRLQAASIRFLQRETGLDKGMYSGAVTAAIVTEDVRVGDTLEVEYSVMGQNPVFEGAFSDSAAWDGLHPVAWRRVRLNHRADLMIHHRLVGSDARPAPQPTVTEESGRRVLTFEARDLPAQIPENGVPADVHAFRWIDFSQYGSWSDVNAWALRLFSAKVEPAALQGPLQSARAAATKEEAVARVLAFVQNDIRYLSVSLGQNSHRPFPPGQVLERRYGDCKDKSQLMVAMLRALHIDAAPVLVSTSVRKRLDQQLPSPLAFDHAIVRVQLGGKVYFLDPTNMGQYGALDKMGQPHAGNQVLPIAAGAGALQVIAQPDSIEAYKRSERVMAAVPGKPVEMLVRYETRGSHAETSRVRLGAMSQAERRKAFDNLLSQRYPDALLVGDPVIADDRANNVLVIEVRYRIDQFFSGSDEGWSVRYHASNLSEVIGTAGARRAFPFALGGAPTHIEYEFDLTVDAGRAVDPDQKTTRVDNPAFRFTHVTRVDGHRYLGRASIDLLSDRVEPGAMPAFLVDAKKMNDALGSGFRFFKADLDETGHVSAQAARAQEIGKPATPDQLRARIVALDREVADAQAAGGDSAALLCQRAQLKAELGLHEDALRDASLAIQRAPRLPHLLRCRGDVWFAAGKFRDSEADYTLAIARGATSGGAYFDRGVAGLYLNKAAAARADFATAAGKAEGTERLRVNIWSAMAGLQERGATVPEGAESAPDPQATWLAAVPAMFAGRHTPDHIVALASRGAGSALDLRLTEAYFYGGKYFLFKGDRLRARAWLQRALDKRLPNNIFAIAARHELARMTP